MTTANIGIKGNNAVVPYVSATKRTKQITLVKTTDITFSTTGASLGTYAIPRAAVIFYADSSGSWRMKFNITMICSSGSRGDVTATFTNVVFKNVSDFKQAVSVTTDSNTGVFGWAAPNASTINMYHATSTTDEYNLSGDVELNAEPTTYTIASNMEGAVAVDVYIPNATSSSAGLIPRYESSTFSPTFTRATPGTLSFAYTARQGFYTRIGNLVTFIIDVRITSFSAGTSSGSWIIGGLPYAASTLSSYAPAVCNIALYQWAFTSQPIATIAHGSTTINLDRMVSDNVFGALDNPKDGSIVFLTGSYLAA